MSNEIVLTSDLATQVNAAHKSCKRAMQDAIFWACETGRLLVDARNGPGKNRFRPWIRENCEFDRSTAYRYIDVYEYIVSHGETHNFEDLNSVHKAIKDERREKKRANKPGTSEIQDHRVATSLQQFIERGARFATIYADPPWQYDNQGTRAATDDHYDTMTVDEICAEPVGEIAAEDAHLHLWTTNAFLFKGLDVMEAWGFTYKSCFVWCKKQMGIGNYWRVSHEFLLFGVRGHCPFRTNDMMSWGVFDRLEHSRKPKAIREMIEKTSPGPYLEMYGREFQPWTPWSVYGNEVEQCFLELSVGA